MKNDIHGDYKKWLTDMAYRWTKPYGSYRKIIDYLYSREFYSKLEKDQNREEDGKEMRMVFSSESKYTYPDVLANIQGPCSVLELMCGLARRCEIDIMGDLTNHDRTGYWFYNMLQSLHLDFYTDDVDIDSYAEDIVDRFLERKYEKNGDGSLFTIKNPKGDLRKVEIWYQMQQYLNEQLFS